MVTQAKQNIEALGFFSKVDFNVEPGSAPDKLTLDINVTEQSTGDYGVTAGYDSQQGILGELSVTERNFLGRGQYVRASIGASQTGNTFDFSFTEPYFMGLKVAAGLDVYRHQTNETTDDIYGTTSTGGQVRLGLPVTRDVTASLFTGVDQTLVTDKVAPFSAFFTDGQQLNKAWVGYTLTYNGLDDVNHPTEGLYATLTQQYVGWDYSFIKTEAKARYFMNVFPDAGIVASVKGQGGIINDFGGTINPIEAFQYGSQLVRGFTPGQMGPRIGGASVGYTAYAGASAEAEFPIPMLPETYGLHGAIWADAAIVSGQGASGALDATSIDQPIKSAVGTSVIWDSPFGPLRGDMAFVLTQATDDKVSRVCASIACPVFQLTIQNLL